MLTNAVLYRHITLAERQRQQLRRQEEPRSLQPFEYIPMDTTVAQIVTSLKQDDFLPGKKLSDLLVSFPNVQKALKQMRLQRQLDSYRELNWFQKLFCDQPSAEHIKLKPIPLSDLESLYPHKADQVKLFDALCDLHERRMIIFKPEHPAQVSLTAMGKLAIQLITKVENPPAYEGHGFSATG